ncbi:PfkB family carbohydrate kinase [Isoptericola halotolerans]|uniref:Sugar/nucleoside kinase (Ribokinase family) n=1 Tax=Isoptericola halotolerans TaxID=300560 RepID=A0ABX2A364_9MICO|nr:PfkB family carbohydrate kinase [Isoptericola halotolerans]NOV96058.1 sugar/nucleoside kinase (ribokinase family) [Isoptericola halotolerans]
MSTCWFVGLTTLDVVHRATARPGSDEKVTAVRQDVAAGGPAANAAVTAAALGVRAVLITALGDGPVAMAARSDLAAHGVEVQDVAAGSDFPLAVSAVLVDDATGERSVVSADAALADAPAPSNLPQLPTPDLVLLDGHHPAIARAVVEHVGTLDRRPPVLLDAGRWREVFAELIPAADVAALSADFSVPGHDDGASGARALGAGAVVVTHGGDPVEWFGADGSGTVDVPEVEVRDTLGAGDAFHGALAAALAGGAALSEACAQAARVASTRVAHDGPRAWLAELRG